MVLALDTGATVKMTLLVDNDSQESWVGTDDLDDYNMHVQGTNSESWLVSKNATETGTLTVSAADMSGTGNHFNMWMQTNLTQYLTSITVTLQSSSGNYRLYTIGTSSVPEVTGEFHCFALDLNNGGIETGTFNPASVPTIAVEINNSSSGNIRSVINNWIDAMYYGRGLTFDGSSTSDNMFTEATAIDELEANKYGVLFNIDEQIFVQGDIVFDDDGGSNTQSSNGENVVFTEKTNTTNTYRLILIGADNTITFNNTNISATGAAQFGFDSSGTIGSFDMTGGGLKKVSSAIFKSGQTITNVNFTECRAVDTNGATLDGCNFISTIEPSSGALLVNVDTEAEACTNLSFLDYALSNRYAVYVAASVTEFDMDNWYFDDPNNTDHWAVYWLGDTGTLTINAVNGTNLVSAGCRAELGGTVLVVANPVTMTVTVKDTASPPQPIENALVLVWVTDDTNYPYDATVNITSSGTLATVTHVGHGMETDDYVRIYGVNEAPYNGSFQITVNTSSEYEYTMLGDPASPATGTPKCTFVVINGLTNSSGVITDTRTWGSNQDITGWGRKSTGSPYYKESGIFGTIDNGTGLSSNIQLGDDE